MVDQEEFQVTRNLLIQTRKDLAALRMVVQSMLITYGNPRNNGKFDADFAQQMRDELLREPPEPVDDPIKTEIYRKWHEDVQAALDEIFGPLIGIK